MKSTRDCRSQPLPAFESLGVEEATRVRGGGPRPPILDIPIWIDPPVPPVLLPAPLPLP